MAGSSRLNGLVHESPISIALSSPFGSGAVHDGATGSRDVGDELIEESPTHQD
jgi:hypothetical protein